MSAKMECAEWLDTLMKFAKENMGFTVSYWRDRKGDVMPPWNVTLWHMRGHDTYGVGDTLGEAVQEAMRAFNAIQESEENG